MGQDLGPGALDTADHLALLRLVALYGHLVDGRAWSRLGEIFTSDVMFDSSAYGSPVRHSLEELQRDWADPTTPHPLAHHGTNVLIDPNADGSVTMVSKGIGVLADGRTRSVTYTDIVLRTPEGWRISSRVAIPRVSA
jgi:hypothetical protein